MANLSQKQAVQRETLKRINQESFAETGFFSLPYRLPGLIAFIPAYFIYRLAHNHLSGAGTVIIMAVVFLLVQTALGFYFRSLRRRHPGTMWQLLIR